MKKIKKLCFLVLFAILTIAFMGSKSFAETGSAYFSLYNKTIGRPTGYYFTEVNGGQTKPVIKIIKTNSAGTVDETPSNTAIYCLKDGVGFGSDQGTVTGPIEYTQYFDMKSSDFVNSSTTYRNQLPANSTTYNEIVWILENLSMPSVSKVNLYNATGLSDDDFLDYLNSTSQVNDVIEVIQQAAIWYYANSTTSDDQKYQPLKDALFYYASSSSGTQTELTNLYKGEGQEFVDNPFTTVYDYFVDGAANAVKNGYTYQTNSSSSTLTFDKSKATIKASGSNYLIGPYKIEASGNYSNFAGTITKNGQAISNATIVGTDGSTQISGTSTTEKLKNSIGNNFYIVLPIEEKSYTVQINVSGNYSSTDLTYWSTAANLVNANQPVVLISKDTKTYSDSDSKVAPKPTGSYNLQLIKVDPTGKTKLSGAKFNVTLADGTSKEYTTDSNGQISISNIAITASGTDTIKIEETEAPEGYSKLLTGPIQIQVTKTLQDGKFIGNAATLATANTNASVRFSNNTAIVTIKNTPKIFDLALRKFIVSIDGNAPSTSREPQITQDNLKALANRTANTTFDNGTTAYKTHPKNVLTVKTGSKVVYTIRVYNEGGVDGKATEITDYLPAGLELTPNSSINSKYGWSADSTGKIIKTAYLANTNLTAFNSAPSNGQYSISYADVQIECTVTAKEDELATYLKNVAEITKSTNDYNYSDIDSTTDNLTDKQKNQYNPGTSTQGKGYEDDDDFEDLILNVATGSYNLQLIKVDSTNTKQRLEGAKFKVTFADGTSKEYVTDSNGQISIPGIEIKETGTDTITIEETETPNGYSKLLTGAIQVRVTKILQNGSYVGNAASLVTANENANVNFENNTAIVTIKNTPKLFDLALRKFITSVDGNAPETSRDPQITQDDLKALAEGKTDFDNGTTTNKNHTKDALTVSNGSKVVYTIRVYNEGDIDGQATEITDYLPEGLKLAENSSINNKYGWKTDSTGKIVTTSYLAGKNISAFNKALSNNKYSISYEDVQIECEVTATSSGINLKNIAEITKTTNNENKPDRDSTPNDLTDDQKNNYNPGTSTKGKGYEDDDDFENLKLKEKYFDLALRKFISKVNDKEYDREPKIDLTNLKNGTSTTATYNHQKDPVQVKAGDIVTYTIKVYNEGEVDGYVDEITDHLPPELQYIDNEFNKNNGWTLDTSDTTGRTVKNSTLSRSTSSDNLLKAFEGSTLSSKSVQIQCKVINNAPVGKQITNIAEITKYENDLGLKDRDSSDSNLNLPSDDNLPGYKGNTENKDDLTDKDYYYKGQEDDDDFEKVILQKFDLALRKFITGVNDKQVTDRVPQVDTSNFGKIVDGKEVTTNTYNHTKEPVRVCQNDTVYYTIRIFNEGTMNGYASVIKDDIPDGLEFLPDNDTNKTYRWTMLDEKGNATNDVKNAKYITTDYLSKEQEKTAGANLIKAFNSSANGSTPDYKDVIVAFKVTEPNTSDRIIINKAQISKHTDEDGNTPDDIDSTPDVWNEGEDDQDIEKIYVKYFDLALRKWVTQAIVIEEGQEKVMNTGHKAEDDPESVVKVEINKKRLNDTVVKFRYSIRITNEGEIAGYAKEISDYIPSGLKFNQADNPKWQEADGKITTDQLKDTLLQPGESTEIDVLLTWENSEDNMGIMTNVAEISEDYNDSHTPDIDSTPNNKKDGEDDIDDAPVALTTVAGSKPQYIALISSVLAVIGTGITLIMKFVI